MATSQLTIAAALLLPSACAFTLGRAPCAPTMRRPLVTVMAEEEEEPAEAPPAAAEATNEIEGNVYTVRAPMVSLGSLFGGKSDEEPTMFDFSSREGAPSAVRGKGGLNDQGFEPYDKAAVDSVAGQGTPTYIVGLGLGALAAVALSVFNLAS